jgi:hypothetical protein
MRAFIGSLIKHMILFGGIIMDERERRRAFQKVKSMSNDKFWNWMNFIHSRAYGKAAQHYEEAMGIVLQPKQAAAVKAKATEIREQWDGMATITMDETEGTELQSVGV